MRHAVEKREQLMYEGVEAFVKFLDRNKTPRPGPDDQGWRDGITVECALWWNDAT